MTPLTPQIAAVAAVMDEIDRCRNPLPCDLCRQRMQSILDMGAAAERDRIRQLATDNDAEYAGPPHPCRCHDGACQLTIRDRIPFATLLDAPAVPTEGTTTP